MFESYQNPYVVAAAPEDVRATFIRRTYGHLAAAVGAFVLIEFLLFQIPGIDDKVMGILARSPFSWLIVLGGFMVVSWLANKWALTSASKGMQYAGLSLYVVAQAVIFLPLLLLAASPRFLNAPEIIGQAAVITGTMFAGLTLIAFTTRKDFSFLGGILKVGFLVALGIIVASIFMGFSLGLLFSGAMVLLASISILYSTSNIIHHYGTEQYVAAALGLFASVALLFWYVLRILMILRGND
ncbi:MAG TPA: permease [Verrucomicrobiales bacterium]|jgi:FtsH-binding integral membrane protein|nr:permease [Verrucomicrobiales bacterium]